MNWNSSENGAGDGVGYGQRSALEVLTLGNALLYLSHGQNSLYVAHMRKHEDHVGSMIKWATRLYIQSFDHGSLEMESARRTCSCVF